MLSSSPQSIRPQATTSLVATSDQNAGLPDASHINVGISPTNSTKPKKYPNMFLNCFMFSYHLTDFIISNNLWRRFSCQHQHHLSFL